MKKPLLLLFIALNMVGCGLLAHKPEGDLIYCSYRCSGAAGLGTDYCELIADIDSVPKVVVVLDEGNRFDDPVIRRTYTVDKSVVEQLQGILEQLKVYKLNGYNYEEPICGGHSNRIYMEYSSGDKVNAFWYGTKIKKEAITAYNTIEYFFSPWREQARAEGGAEADGLETGE